MKECVRDKDERECEGERERVRERGVRRRVDEAQCEKE